MNKYNRKRRIQSNNGGFIIADFLFSFVMVIGIGIFMFFLTFSLATVEVAQYIIWSTARNYSAAHKTPAEAELQARAKFTELIKLFPLLTNSDGESGWFELSEDDLIIGKLDEVDNKFTISTSDKRNEYRQPWTGARGIIKLKMFSNLNVPFLGKIKTDATSEAFNFPIRAFIIRNPSRIECVAFFYVNRYERGIKTLEMNKVAPTAIGLPQNLGAENGFGEDNGC